MNLLNHKVFKFNLTTFYIYQSDPQVSLGGTVPTCFV